MIEQETPVIQKLSPPALLRVCKGLEIECSRVHDQLKSSTSVGQFQQYRQLYDLRGTIGALIEQVFDEQHRRRKLQCK